MIDDWFVQFEPVASPTRRTFIFPHAGASVAAYRRWVPLAGERTDLRAVQLPGSGGRIRERGFVEMTALVDAIVSEIGPLLDLPYVFFGHSLGALVAFETALALRSRAPELCRHLVVASSRAPQVPLRGPMTHKLPDDAFLAKLEESSMTPRMFLTNRKLIEMFLLPLRQSAELGEMYAYDANEKLDIPITALRGTADTSVQREEMEAWQAVTHGPCRVLELSGDHFFVQENAAEIAGLLWNFGDR